MADKNTLKNLPGITCEMLLAEARRIREFCSKFNAEQKEALTIYGLSKVNGGEPGLN